MRIAILPKTSKDKNFVEKFKERGVEVKVINEKHLFSKFSNEIFFGYFNQGKEAIKNFEEYLKTFENYDINLMDIDLFFLRNNELFNRVDNFFEVFFTLLEKEGVKVINSVEAIKKSKNKFYSYYLLKKAGIHIPESFVGTDYNRAYFSLKDYKKLVFKPIQGKGGSGIVITEDISTGGDVLSLYAISKKIPIIQRFIENNRDIRIIVVGDEVIGG
ncbi:MAG: RimK family alpha-L-glutamate ligase, partial [Candidatus Altarchaeaceae archaeon]